VIVRSKDAAPVDGDTVYGVIRIHCKRRESQVTAGLESRYGAGAKLTYVMSSKQKWGHTGTDRICAIWFVTRGHVKILIAVGVQLQVKVIKALYVIVDVKLFTTAQLPSLRLHPALVFEHGRVRCPKLWWA
jgi:hypothetical protein